MEMPSPEQLEKLKEDQKNRRLSGEISFEVEADPGFVKKMFFITGTPNPIPDDGRRFAVVEEFGDRAKVVAPYKPNPKQTRAQRAARRKNRSRK